MRLPRNCLRAFLLLLLAPCAQAGCPSQSGVSLQVLGSGGPIADDARASSAYVVWVDGVSRVLIDAGGGAFLRFGEAQASFADLDFVGLSHLHTDHSADFPALLKSGNFSGRKRPLHVAGPDGDGPFPGIGEWLDSLLAREGGAYRYLGGFLDGSAGLPMLVSREVGAADTGPVYVSDTLRVEAMHVPHGIVPALAFRVAVGDQVIVFASDQNGSNAEFVDFASGAQLLVMHLVVPEGVTGVARRLHAPPSVVGAVAAAAGVDRLLLSHFMARSLADLDGNVARVESAYDGEVLLAEDLMCVEVGSASTTAR